MQMQQTRAASQDDPAAPVATVKCPSCAAGKVEEWVAGHVSGWKPCCVCGGSGTRLAPQPRRIAA